MVDKKYDFVNYWRRGRKVELDVVGVWYRLGDMEEGRRVFSVGYVVWKCVVVVVYKSE
jgi:hypothetical protein